MRLEMYKIMETDTIILVPCEKCSQKGIVDKGCQICGGKGTHKKTISAWSIRQNTIPIERINRAEKDYYYQGQLLISRGELQYWISADEFYSEHEKLVHFTLKDAENECKERNRDILPLMKILMNNNLK